MSIQLPASFESRMQKQLQDDYPAFRACYEQDGYAGLRVNTSKISVEDFLKITPFKLEPVPWTQNGFYYDREDDVTHHPHYFAGLYYIQEPSAMLPASRLPVKPGDRVLDLCAAPGGKSTELASKLAGDGLLVSNDVSPSRAKALVKNLTQWGCRNCCITGETPERLLETFGHSYFDKILVDAPCSGEGMFRKDTGLISSWLERGPEYFAPIQKEILYHAVQMLKPGGYLVYSTCTFSQDEDEAVIQWILDQDSALSLVRPEWYQGFSEGMSPYSDCVRLWPHHIRGEGHFTAVLQKAEDENTAGSMKVKENKSQSVPVPVTEFMKDIPSISLKNRTCKIIEDQCYLMPEESLPRKLRYLRTGLQLGTIKKDRFEPSQALAMTLKASNFSNCCNLSAGDQRLVRYLKGETIELHDEEAAEIKKGWVLICVDGFGLGWGKYANGSIKNKYYAGWRLQ